MGKFHGVLSPGLNILIPILDKVKYVQSLKEIAIDIPQQAAITAGVYIFFLRSSRSCKPFSHVSGNVSRRLNLPRSKPLS